WITWTGPGIPFGTWTNSGSPWTAGGSVGEAMAAYTFVGPAPGDVEGVGPDDGTVEPGGAEARVCLGTAAASSPSGQSTNLTARATASARTRTAMVRRNLDRRRSRCLRRARVGSVI